MWIVQIATGKHYHATKYGTYYCTWNKLWWSEIKSIPISFTDCSINCSVVQFNQDIWWFYSHFSPKQGTFYLPSPHQKLSLLYEKKILECCPHLPSLLGCHTFFYLFSEEEKSPVDKELHLAFAFCNWLHFLSTNVL